MSLLLITVMKHLVDGVILGLFVMRVDNFINNGFAGDKEKNPINQTSSIEKFYKQLTREDFSEDIGIEFTDDNKIKCQAIEILAHAVWLWRLPASNSNGDGRKRSVLEILNFVKEWPDCQNSLDKCLDGNKYFDNYKGFAMPGIGYNTNKANELAYIINFFKLYLDKKDDDEIISFLKKENKVSIVTTFTYTKETVNEKVDYIKKAVNKKDKNDKPNKISVNNALLHLSSSEEYEPIISSSHKEKIERVFKKLFEHDLPERYTNEDIDKQISILKNILIKKYGPLKNNFYNENIKNIWLGGLDFDSKNLILHGAPGTGKTFITESTLKARKKLKEKKKLNILLSNFILHMDMKIL